MGRPKVDFRIDEEILTAVERIADELECSRSAVLRRAVKNHVRAMAGRDSFAQIDLEEFIQED